MKQIYNASTSWKKASIKKPIHPLRFFSKLKWLDGSPLKILPYRQKIFSNLLYKFDDDESLYYSLSLLCGERKTIRASTVCSRSFTRYVLGSPLETLPVRSSRSMKGKRMRLGLIQEARQSQPGAA